MSSLTPPSEEVENQWINCILKETSAATLVNVCATHFTSGCILNNGQEHKKHDAL